MLIALSLRLSLTHCLYPSVMIPTFIFMLSLCLNRPHPLCFLLIQFSSIQIKSTREHYFQDRLYECALYRKEGTVLAFRTYTARVYVCWIWTKSALTLACYRLLSASDWVDNALSPHHCWSATPFLLWHRSSHWRLTEVLPGLSHSTHICF